MWIGLRLGVFPMISLYDFWGAERNELERAQQVRVSGAEQRARSNTKETWCALGRYTPTEVSTYKSHQSLVKTELESQPPACDWTGGVLKRIKLNGDL
jgi:hypothetical protein